MKKLLITTLLFLTISLNAKKPSDSDTLYKTVALLRSGEKISIKAIINSLKDSLANIILIRDQLSKMTENTHATADSIVQISDDITSLTVQLSTLIGGNKYFLTTHYKTVNSEVLPQIATATKSIEKVLNRLETDAPKMGLTDIIAALEDALAQISDVYQSLGGLIKSATLAAATMTTTANTIADIATQMQLLIEDPANE